MLDIIDTYGEKFVLGLQTTVELVALATVLGFLLSVPLALARVSRNPLLAAPAYAYVFFFRGTPLLIQLFLIYYGTGQFESIRESFLWSVLREAWWCGLIALTLNTAAYTGEILRGGILGVPHGEVEAAKASGMSWALMTRRIVLPKAFRIAWPAYGNEIVFLIKGSALVSTITILDLMGETRGIFANTLDLNAYLVAGIMYFVLVYIFDHGWRTVERRINRYLGERPQDKTAAAATTTGPTN